MRLSFIVPVYNVEKYLQDCLQSLYAQSLPEDDFEVVIVNDGSLDNSLAIVEYFQTKHSNLHVFNQKNQGLSAARNLGIQKAQGDYILCVDSDDYLLPGTVYSLLKQAVENDLELIRGEYCHCEEDGKLLSPIPVDKAKLLYADKIFDGEVLYTKIFGSAFFSPLLMIKRTFLLSNNLWFTKGMYFEDIDFALRLSFIAKRVMFLPVIFYVYRLRKGSITFSMNEKKLNDLVSIILKLRKYSRSDNFHVETRLAIESNLTKLFVYFLLRLTEFDFPKRKQIVEPLLVNRLRPLLLIGNKKEKFISFLFNLMGSKIFYLLYPIIKLKSIMK